MDLYEWCHYAAEEFKLSDWGRVYTQNWCFRVANYESNVNFEEK